MHLRFQEMHASLQTETIQVIESDLTDIASKYLTCVSCAHVVCDYLGRDRDAMLHHWSVFSNSKKAPTSQFLFGRLSTTQSPILWDPSLLDPLSE